MIQCKHKPISHNTKGITKLEKAHYPHISICEHCGQKIVPKRSWTYTATDCLIFLGLIISTFVVVLSRAFDSWIMLQIGSVGVALCFCAFDHAGSFIAWKSIDDDEFAEIPDIDSKICLDALEELDDIRFRG